MRRHLLWLCAVLNFAVACGDNELPEPTPPPPLPAPALCVFTPADIKNGIGEGICQNAACAVCYGEFTDYGRKPVAPEGCIVHPGTPIQELCVNDCAQCGM